MEDAGGPPLLSRALAKKGLDLIFKGVFVHHACACVRTVVAPFLDA